MRSTLFAVVVSATAMACSHSAVVDTGGAISPATLNAATDRYDGTVVTVFGYMQSEFENRGVWDNKEARAAGEWRRRCVSLLVPQAMDTSRFHGKYVVLRGQFIKHLPPNFVHLGGCNTTSLDLLELPVLAPVPPRSRPNNSFNPKPLRGSG